MYRVLLVEDEDIIRRGIRQAIPWEACGCTVVGEARNGVEGKAQIEALLPNIVVVDLDMPIMGGLEMIAQTRASHPYVAIVLTGYSDFSMAQSAIHLGVFEYLLKPLDKTAMEDTLQRAAEACQRMATLAAHSAPQPDYCDQSPLSQIKNQTSHDPIVEAILQYIQENYTKKITLAGIADALHYSERYISQKFQRAFGTSVIDYLTRYRIHQALLLLQDTQIPLSDMGYRCGIGEYKYFSHVFKKYMHCSPRDYRQRSQSPS